MKKQKTIKFHDITHSHLLEDIGQSLHIVLIVLLAILPWCKALALLFHIHFPNMLEVNGLHHPQLAASSHQGLQAFHYLRLLPFKETGAEYGEAQLLVLLEDVGQLGGTSNAGAG